MGTQLTLRPRFPANGRNTWSDSFILTNAIDSIAKGKSFSKGAVWGAIGAKIILATEEAQLGNVEDDTGKVYPTPPKRVPGDPKEYFPHLVDVQIELNNTEVNLLWRELCKLPPEAFGNQPGETFPAGKVYIMMKDIADQLGKEMPQEVDE